MTRASAEERSFLSVEVVVPDEDPNDLGPQVRLLVDATDYLDEIFEGVGCDPDELIGPYSPLRDGDVPHDVAVMRCGCGVTDCSLLVVNVARDGDDVVWDDFRTGPGMDPIGLVSIASRTLRFDATAYTAELDRAHRARDWEPPWRTAGRLAREALFASERTLEDKGFMLKRIWQFKREIHPRSRVRRRRKLELEHALGVELYEYRGDEKRQIVLAFRTDSDDPTARADEIASIQLETPSDRWPVAYRGEWVSL